MTTVNKKLIQEVESPFHSYLLFSNFSSELVKQAKMFAMLFAFDTKDYVDHPDIKIIDSENLNTLGVEDIRDVMAIENTSQFKGLYHVLGGKISPIEGIGPQNLEIDSLVAKVKNKEVKELIFALSSTMEGDTTNFYIFKQIEDYDVLTSTIARGISVGDGLEYADEVTLGRSIVNRIPFEQSIKN